MMAVGPLMRLVMLIGLTASALTAVTHAGTAAAVRPPVSVGRASDVAAAGPEPIASPDRSGVSAWTITSTANPTGAQLSHLLGVSCTSENACTAVGYYVNSAGIAVTLAEAWDGTTWAVQPTPNPTDGQSSVLSGVSCTSKKACTAVGYFFNSTGSDVTLAEAWDGRAWTVQPTPSPMGAHNSLLLGVSCTSRRMCFAVGYYQDNRNNTFTLAEAWDGAGWGIPLTPTRTGSKARALLGVSCTSQKACTAVGYHVNGGGSDVKLVERWDGTTWAVQPTPNPTEAKSSVLLGVSCTSKKACTAVGYDRNNSSTATALTEAWDGVEWTVQPIPNPTRAADSALLGVSCTSKGACTAVGNYLDYPATVATLAEARTGTTWMIQPTPTPNGALDNSVLLSVSCTSDRSCTAVGYFYNGTDVALAERHTFG
jgi:hypothetical protein